MKWVLLIIFFLLIGFVSATLEVNPVVVKSVVKLGEGVNVPISIVNTGGERVLALESSGKFISLEKGALLIEKNGDDVFNVRLDSSGLREGVYSGVVFIDSVEIPIIFEVESSEVLIDSFAEIAPRLSRISPGGTLEVDVKVFNLKSKTGDARVEYRITDFSGELLVVEEQDVSVANQIQLRKSFVIPEEVEFGEYILSVLVYSKGQGSVGTSSLLFNVGEEPSFSPPERNYILYILSLVVIVLIGIFLVFNYYWNRRVMDTAKNWNKKVVDLRRIKLSDVSKAIHKLEDKKRLLERAFERGYIKRDSYLEGRKKINEMLRKLKKRL